MIGFWRWLLFGVPGGRSGLAQAFADAKALACLIVSGILAWATMGISVSKMGGDLMLPFAAVLVGLCFASIGNSSALLQQPETEAIVDRRGRGMEDYAFGYQFAVLSTLSAMILWGLAVLGVFESAQGALGYAVRFVLFFFASFAVGQCWGTALFAAEMIRARYVIRRAAKMRDERKKAEADNAASPETNAA